MNNEIAVNEIFTSIQGEGPSTGQLATFIRLFGCHLKCTFCDTPFTWKFSDLPHDFDKTIYNQNEERTDYTLKEIQVKIASNIDLNLLVITGGEPLLQSKALYNLFLELEDWYQGTIEIETSGTLTPGFVDCFENVFFNVSPKLSNSGNSLEARYNPTHLKRFIQNGRSIFKFMVSNISDFEEIESIQSAINIPNNLIWVMPITSWGIIPLRSSSLSDIAEKAIEKRWNVSARLHTQIWGNKRGV